MERSANFSIPGPLGDPQGVAAIVAKFEAQVWRRRSWRPCVGCAMMNVSCSLHCRACVSGGGLFLYELQMKTKRTLEHVDLGRKKTQTGGQGGQLGYL